MTHIASRGEIEGFIVSQQFDNIVLAGDFNVDFDRGGSLADLLLDFINIVACDLSYIGFTYERDDGLVRSWIDHIMCSQSLCPSITNVHISQSGTNISDHLPLFFNLDLPCSQSPSSSTSKPVSINWSKASPSQIADYQDLISEKLSDPPVELLCCSQPDCSIHNDLLDGYADHIMDTLLNCAFRCLYTLSIIVST